MKQSLILIALIGVALAIWFGVGSEKNTNGELATAHDQTSDEANTSNAQRSQIHPPTKPPKQAIDASVHLVREKVHANLRAAVLKMAEKRRMGGAPADQARLTKSELGNPAPLAAKNTANKNNAVTPGEAAVLEVYESMASALSRKELSCAETGAAVFEFAQEGKSAFTALANERSAKIKEAASEGSGHLDSAALQLHRLRQELRTGIARCPDEPKIQEAFQVIAASTMAP